MKAQEVDISFQINIQRLDNERFICCHNEVSLATEQRKKIAMNLFEHYRRIESVF